MLMCQILVFFVTFLCRQDCQDEGPISILVQADGEGGENIPHDAAEKAKDNLMSDPLTAGVRPVRPFHLPSRQSLIISIHISCKLPKYQTIKL